MIVPLLLLLSSLVLAITVLALRLLTVIHHTHARSSPPPRRQQDAPASLAVFLGSGGHTAEMMRLVSGLDWQRYSTRVWIISSGDLLSESKALALEKQIGTGSFTLLRIPRARRVHQSYLTSPFTTLYSLAYCLWHISLAPLLASVGPSGRRVFADLILLNGPGSCVPIAVSAFLPRLLDLPSPSLIYIESLARTRRLSVSAKLVRPLVDRFFVQWETLRDALREGDAKRKVGAWRLKAEVEWEGWLV
ncbi:oligosaccharide biosynthesis protein Alg14 like-domain-containing protein [Leucosporidium creatinivorum]|uniref:UDP-N-acetylglucosamine transferase subunit ALG14 n=1 Tax=Leucosporidium creatinivorum TaxID=106004 RepID=A0A1Y2D271_9BASI|nr:oligosaccharide biosynthesis protein Alg14 like-domain-containing protein [Leucosporidium creatinivorum]